MQKLPTKLNRTARVAIIALGVGFLSGPAFSNEISPERVIRLDGTSNTRDIGGYPATDLRTVRWRQIIRSENLSRLTAEDFRELEEIGVKTVIDLRTDRERERSPTVWQGDNPPRFFNFAVGEADDRWYKAQRRMTKSNRFTAKQSQAHMVEGYRMMAEAGVPSYRQLMDLVLDESNWPILIHCNAGKDRSGVAIALILEALGVDRATIMEEYLLTNKLVRAEQKAAFLAEKLKFTGGSARVGRTPTARAWLPIVGVQPEMLEAFYASVDERYGSMAAFLDELGVDQADRNALVASLTTEPSELAMRE